MTTEQRSSILSRVLGALDEKRFMARWFRQNACVRHGIPFEDNDVPVVVEQQSTTPLPYPVATAPIQVAQPTEPKAGASWGSGAPTWVKAATVAAGVGAAGLAGYGVSQYFDKDEPPAVVVPVEQPPGSGSITAYLQDNGFNLPEKSNGK